MKATYKRTTFGCFIAIFTQAIITNLTAILFVPMMDLYGFSYGDLGILVAINFVSQVTADISFSKAIDKIGYRKIVLPTCITAIFGLLLFALSPSLFPEHRFLCIAVATFIFSFSSGLMEITLSPIVAAIPGNDKGPAMSLMHSFYAWGQAATIIITTLCVFIFGKESWQWIAAFWAVVPALAFVLFISSPFPETTHESTRLSMKDLLFKPFYIALLLAILFGAGAEVSMNQYSSAFMEKGLMLPKILGDLIGMCGFAIMLGLGRTLYGIFGAKINLFKALTVSSLIAVLCYIITALSTVSALGVAACVLCGIATSLLWPGTIVIASDKYPLAGAWMFAILAAAGDIGAGLAPAVSGKISDGMLTGKFINVFSSFLNVPPEQGAIRFGLLIAGIFPLLAFFCHRYLKRNF